MAAAMAPQTRSFRRLLHLGPFLPMGGVPFLRGVAEYQYAHMDESSGQTARSGGAELADRAYFSSSTPA